MTTTLALAGLILAVEATLIAWVVLFVTMRRRRREASAPADDAAMPELTVRLQALEERNRTLDAELASAHRTLAQLMQQQTAPPVLPDVPPADAPTPDDNLDTDLFAAVLPAAPELEEEPQRSPVPVIFADDTANELLDDVFGSSVPETGPEEQPPDPFEELLRDIDAVQAAPKAGTAPAPEPPPPAALSQADIEELIDLFETPGTSKPPPPG